jgi:electron transfer flavoprotein beta subunit
MPAVISVDLRLNEPRYASLPNIMKAKRKPLEEISPADLGVEMTQRLKVIKTKEPDSREAGLILENIDQLVEKIQENVGG